MGKAPRPALYLVRHADAGDRTRFSGDDLERPLSAKGNRQSELIAARLADRSLAALLTSPARRCVETLEPLATTSHIELEELDVLVEGADPVLALAALLERSPSSKAAIVACSHGDILGSILEELLLRGLPTKGKVSLPKGITVEVTLDDSGSPEHLTFVPAK
jgi:phosphohistidine phosphatase SixA